MTASQAVAGIGTELRRFRPGSLPDYDVIAEVTNISGPGLATENIDVTNMQSPDNVREKIPSLKDGGDVTIDLNFLPGDATHLLLLDDWKERRVVTWNIVWSDLAKTRWKFTGFISSIPPAAPVDDKLSLSATITVTGSPVFNVKDPVVAGLAPATGAAAGGVNVVITGTDFTGATAVKFGVVDAVSFVVDSDTQITAVSPAQPAGVVNIEVTTPDGRSVDVAADDYTVT